ncbi:MAG: DNA-directed RNA polymerase subunit alpha [Elusimicrobia bacterium]|nr:DNA-directed RNA polymerase subunit alpha [Elusimicrobiota bacterium]
MKFRDFQLPQKIEWIEEKEDYGKFECEPFERGYGHTIGNSLRRILLSSMEGAVITSVKIDGVLHEYSSIKGVKEDALEIVFNLKQLRFKLFTEDSQTVVLETSGKKTVTGKDFKLNQSVELLNPDIYIATLNENGKMYMEATIEKGRGYSLAADRQEKVTAIGEIPIDAAFSPVKKVNYSVENARVGQATDYDKLITEIWTDGNVKPKEAVAYAAQILKKSLVVFDIPAIEDIELGQDNLVAAAAEDVSALPLEALKISTRTENLLARANIKSIGDLVSKSEDEISNIEKVGKKSIDEILEKLEEFSKERNIDLKLKGSAEEEEEEE